MYEIRVWDKDDEEYSVTCKKYSILTDSHLLWMHLEDDTLRHIPIEELKFFDAKEV